MSVSAVGLLSPGDMGHVVAQVRQAHGLKPIGQEGKSGGRWILLDYGDFVVHVFQGRETIVFSDEGLDDEPSA